MLKDYRLESVFHVDLDEGQQVLVEPGISELEVVKRCSQEVDPTCAVQGLQTKEVLGGREGGGIGNCITIELMNQALQHGRAT